MTMKFSKRHLCVLGHIGKEIKRGSTAGPDGVLVAEFSVASTFSRKINGQWTDETEWTNCRLYGEGVETFMKHVGPGSRIQIEGHLRTEKYTVKNETRYKYYVLVDEYIPLSKKKSDDDKSNTSANKEPLEMAT